MRDPKTRKILNIIWKSPFRNGYSRRRGLSVVETVIYSAILAVMFVVVINILLTIGRSLNSFRAANDINNSASVFMDRVVREIRDSSSVNMVESVFASHPGKLVLNGIDDSGASTKTSFYIKDGHIEIEKDGLELGSLTDLNATTTELIFRYFESSTSTGMVRIEATFQSSRGNTVKAETFYDAAVLRGSY